MKRRQILITVSAEEFDIAHRLGASVLDGEAAIRVLDIMRRGYDVISDLEKIPVISTVRTFEAVGYFGF
jgi:hypothetical protein